ncbi:MAG: hypothetical protein QW723_05720 [Candidatus Bathyarchaeia archaeon]
MSHDLNEIDIIVTKNTQSGKHKTIMAKNSRLLSFIICSTKLS